MPADPSQEALEAARVALEPEPSPPPSYRSWREYILRCGCSGGVEVCGSCQSRRAEYVNEKREWKADQKRRVAAALEAYAASRVAAARAADWPTSRCAPDATHHVGCQCWEARRDAEVAQLREALGEVLDVVEPNVRRYCDPEVCTCAERCARARRLLEGGKP